MTSSESRSILFSPPPACPPGSKDGSAFSDTHHSEPILTFRFWFLSTFWVTAGCAIAAMYYFKPYYQTLSSYAVQLLSWGMGDAMAKYLPKRKFTIFGWSFSLNPGPWNAKEHALIIVAYWGSCYAAYGIERPQLSAPV